MGVWHVEKLDGIVTLKHIIEEYIIPRNLEENAKKTGIEYS